MGIDQCHELLPIEAMRLFVEDERMHEFRMELLSQLLEDRMCVFALS
jgi:hypothetical protein